MLFSLCIALCSHVHLLTHSTPLDHTPHHTHHTQVQELESQLETQATQLAQAKQCEAEMRASGEIHVVRVSDMELAWGKEREKLMSSVDVSNNTIITLEQEIINKESIINDNINDTKNETNTANAIKEKENLWNIEKDELKAVLLLREQDIRNVTKEHDERVETLLQQCNEVCDTRDLLQVSL